MDPNKDWVTLFEAKKNIIKVNSEKAIRIKPISAVATPHIYAKIQCYLGSNC